MVVIAAIGAFFKKIWDWIKQTAWIQPLLIVGLIFAVIFSIKPIVDAVNRGKTAANKASAFYHNYQVSLVGGKDSEADKITSVVEGIMLGKEVDTKPIEKYGNKFFISYVSESCEQCDAAKGGFEYFAEQVNAGSEFFKTVDNTKFNMITIFTDQETTDTETNKSAFVKYLDRHQSFFESCGAVATDRPYTTNRPISSEDIEFLSTSDPDNFLTPTILLVELDASSYTIAGLDGPGVSEVMFGVDGDNDSDKAKTLLDCWNHTGKFSYNEKK